MEGLLALSIGLIGYLFYRTNGQKRQLLNLQSQFQKLQQQFIQLQQSLAHVNNDEVEVDKPPVETANMEPEPQVSSASLNNEATADPWREQAQPAIPKSSSVSAKSSKAKPTSVEQGLNYLMNLAKNYFSQGNQIVRIGIVVLFFGISFLAKYSIEHSLISIEVRMAGIIIAAMVMLGIGWKLRINNPAYGLIMQGGGIAISYLAIFASFKLYQLIPGEVTFPLLILFSILAMSLAILQDSKALAVTAITGGFLSPIFASTGGGSHIGLFSYYLILNSAIFFVAWFKSWRLLNVIGFAFTFIIASVWGINQYRSDQFATTEPFLIAFFLIYVAISILFATKQKPELKGYVDGTLVFGVPMVGFGLQTALVHHMEYGLAISSAALAIFYLLLTQVLRKTNKENLGLLSQAFFALGIIFATLTIPFALDGRWTAASWAIEGAGFVWISMRQKRELLKYVGQGIQLVGGLLFLADYPYQGSAWVFLNVEFMGVAIVALSALFSAYILQTSTESIKPDREELKSKVPVGENQSTLGEFKQTLLNTKQVIDSVAGIALIVWGLAWWYVGGLLQVDDHVARQYELTLYVAFLAASAGLWLSLQLRWPWPQFNFFPWLLALPLCFYFWPTVFDGHFLENYGFISWPLALATLVMSLYKMETRPLWQATALHSISYILILLVLGYEVHWILDDLGLATAWTVSLSLLIVISALNLIRRPLMQLTQTYPGWPVKQHALAYQAILAPVIIGLMLIWSGVFNFISVLAPEPIRYIPVFNPVDLVQLLAFWAVIRWYSAQGNQVSWLKAVDDRWLLAGLAGFAFIWLNVLLLKAIHVITLVPYNAQALYGSAVVQTSISICWTLIGLILMVFASKSALRQLWIIGAVLTGVVVAKLFLLDLDGQGTIERIVSFLVVGVLLLVVGYFSPVPPAASVIEETSGEKQPKAVVND
jgi:uncharacterized membrane protein